MGIILIPTSSLLKICKILLKIQKTNFKIVKVKICQALLMRKQYMIMVENMIEKHEKKLTPLI